MNFLRQLVVLSIALFVISSCRAGEKSCPAPTPFKDQKFHPGQVWQYKTRAGEEESFITILKVESLQNRPIVHIRVDHVHLKNCSEGPEPDTIKHMPFLREAVDRSVMKLIKEDSKVPDFPGYDDWRKACGGVYTISVAEAVAADEAAFSQGSHCKNN